MIFHRQNKKKLLILIAIILLVVLFFINQQTSGKVSNAVRTLAGHIWDVGDTTSGKLSGLKESFVSKDKLAEELARTRDELEQVRNLKYENIYLRAQNSTLLSLTSAGLQEGIHSRVHASVFSTSGVTPYGTIMITTKAGSLNVGAVVLGKSAIALGNISDISGKVATVHLFSMAERSVDVIIGIGEDAITTKALGVGSGNFVISAPRDAHVQVGDPVFAASALGYIIAIVGEVESNPADAFIRIYARVPFNIQALNSVLVQ